MPSDTDIGHRFSVLVSPSRILILSPLSSAFNVILSFTYLHKTTLTSYTVASCTFHKRVPSAEFESTATPRVGHGAYCPPRSLSLTSAGLELATSIIVSLSALVHSPVNPTSVCNGCLARLRNQHAQLAGATTSSVVQFQDRTTKEETVDGASY